MPARRAITLLEVAVAIILLGAVATLCLRMIRATAAQHQAIGQRQTAIREVANLIEHLGARSWQQLTSETVGDVQLSEQAGRSLPGAECTIEVDRPPEQPEAKRIRISLRWQDRAGQFVRPVCLTAWRYRTVSVEETDNGEPPSRTNQITDDGRLIADN
jgi:type II secretory pathway component PulJ